MNYLADTVAVIHHLRNRPRLGSESNRIFLEADQGLHHIYLSAITLMEILYLSQAKRITLPLDDLLDVIARSPNYEIVPVDAEVVRKAMVVDDVPELHDRVIVATALYVAAPVLTPDHVIAASRHVETIW